MRVTVLGLLLPVVLGCAGKNVVAGEEKNKAQQLEAAVPSWCATTCARLQACPTLPCDCADDVCSCSGPGGSDCPAQCLDTMARFTTGDDACAIAGEHFRQCIDAASCAELERGEETCAPSTADQAACPGASVVDSGSDEPVSPTGPNTSGASGGSSSSGGSNPPDLAGPLVAAPVSCTDSWASAFPNSDGSPRSSGVVCEEGRQGCSDGHEYSWLCAEGSQGQKACSCLVDSHVTGGFDPGPSCPTPLQVNAGCRWNITP